MRKMLRLNHIRITAPRFTQIALVAILLGTVLFFQWLSPTTQAAETLRDAWSIAVSVDQTIEANRWQTAAARQRYCAAQAEQMPQITGSASYRVLDNPVRVNAQIPSNPLMPQGLGVPLQVLQQDFLISGVDITQPVYTFGRIQNEMCAAAQNVRAERSDQRTTELDVRLRVAQAYISVLNAQRAVEVTDVSILSLRKHLLDVKNLLKHGVVVRNDLLAVEVSLAKAEQSKIYSENQLDLARATYNRLLLRPLGSPVDLEDLQEPSGNYDLNCLTQQAAAQRPEISSLSAQSASLDKTACSVEASYKPQLSLSGRFDYIGNDYLQRQGYTSVGVIGQWNMFDAGRVRHQAGEYRRKAEALRRLRADTESLIALQVRQAWLDLDTTRRQLAVNRKAITSADENFDVAANRYKQGAGTNTEVLDAERLRTETYNNFYTSRYATVLALMKLNRAVGGFYLLDDVQPVTPQVPEAAPMPPEVIQQAGLSPPLVR